MSDHFGTLWIKGLKHSQRIHSTKPHPNFKAIISLKISFRQKGLFKKSIRLIYFFGRWIITFLSLYINIVPSEMIQWFFYVIFLSYVDKKPDKLSHSSSHEIIWLKKKKIVEIRQTVSFACNLWMEARLMEPLKTHCTFQPIIIWILFSSINFHTTSTCICYFRKWLKFLFSMTKFDLFL